jgi:hypothetical protein
MKRYKLICIVACLIVVLSLVSNHIGNRNNRVTSLMGLTAVQAYTEGGLANCRYGIAPVNAPVSSVSTFGAGWHLTFSTGFPTPPANDAEFVPVIRINQNKTASGVYLPSYTVIPSLTNSGLGSRIDSNPGSLWIVGNEIDRGPDPGQTQSSQDDVYPEIYATAYHEVYNYIKQRDPSARVAISALVQITPGRLQYLDRVWNSYKNQFNSGMPVDVWNMHVYILPEVNAQGQPNSIANIALGTDPGIAKRESGGSGAMCPLANVYCFAEHDSMSIFVEQITNMRSWMKAHGQQNKPLILSEYSILFPVNHDNGSPFYDEYQNQFFPARVTQFMLNTFNYMENVQDPSLGYPADNNRLVQQWLWFSGQTDGAGRASNLLENDFVTKTLMGQTFQNHVVSLPLERNPYVEKTHPYVGYTNGALTIDAPMAVTFRNNGDGNIESDLTVTFYEDEARTMPITSTVVATTIRGCTTGIYKATAVWPDRAPGVYNYWVAIDSTNQVSINGGDLLEDNFGSSLILIDPDYQLFLPMITKH